MDYRFTVNLRTDKKEYITDALRFLNDYLNAMEDANEGEIEPFEINLYGDPGQVIGKATLKDGVK